MDARMVNNFFRNEMLSRNLIHSRATILKPANLTHCSQFIPYFYAMSCLTNIFIALKSGRYLGERHIKLDVEMSNIIFNGFKLGCAIVSGACYNIAMGTFNC